MKTSEQEHQANSTTLQQWLIPFLIILIACSLGSIVLVLRSEISETGILQAVLGSLPNYLAGLFGPLLSLSITRTVEPIKNGFYGALAIIIYEFIQIPYDTTYFDKLDILFTLFGMLTYLLITVRCKFFMTLIYAQKPLF